MLSSANGPLTDPLTGNGRIPPSTVNGVAELRGHEVEGAILDTATERAACKIIETACESVLAAIIAMVALLRSGRWGWAPIASIGISWIVTAHKATSLTFDLDTDRASRMRIPWFYGFIPSSLARRRIVHACLFVLIVAHLVERTAALALLFVTRRAWLGALLGTEMGAYLLYKALRSDFIVWVPGMGYGASLAYRLVAKVMLDFCALPHMRHSFEAGGACWLISILSNQAVCFVSVWAYAEHYDGPGKLDRAVLFPTFGALAGVWATALIGFLLAIERSYLRTFMSLETGRECAIRQFRERQGDDELRMDVFDENVRLWESIEGEVKAWLNANYTRWQAEKPAWFTPALIAKIPGDFLPKERCGSESALLSRHRGVRGLDGDLD